MPRSPSASIEQDPHFSKSGIALTVARPHRMHSMRLRPRCSVICVSVCSSWPWALHKRINRSCRLECGLVKRWDPRNLLLRDGGRESPREGALFGGHGTWPGMPDVDILNVIRKGAARGDASARYHKYSNLSYACVGDSEGGQQAHVHHVRRRSTTFHVRLPGSKVLWWACVCLSICSLHVRLSGGVQCRRIAGGQHRMSVAVGHPSRPACRQHRYDWQAIRDVLL